ncbi:hypothetical protein [Sphingomonas sp.]|uniref:hypothetical protein n=1 Tax=Sphingomonas sp. TaxID=28214 RepID=UPI001B237EF0|nr:hypothetical protein [Sphingomonas sp.]MBO9713998.1 hypothetical protein [Sphingomonas sp.]
MKTVPTSGMLIVVLASLLALLASPAIAQGNDDFGFGAATEPSEYEAAIKRVEEVADINSEKETAKISDVKDLFQRLQRVNQALGELNSNSESISSGAADDENALQLDARIDEVRNSVATIDCGNLSTTATRFRLLDLPPAIRSRAANPQTCAALKLEIARMRTGDANYVEIKRHADREIKAASDKLKQFAALKDRVVKVAEKLKQSRAALNSQIDSRLRNINSVSSLPWVVAAICLFCLAIMYVVKQFETEIQIEWVSTGQATQFVTIILLLSVITMLAVNDRIGENTLGTLLGGVAGYVLAQGVGRSTARQAERQLIAASQSSGTG